MDECLWLLLDLLKDLLVELLVFLFQTQIGEFELIGNDFVAITEESANPYDFFPCPDVLLNQKQIVVPFTQYSLSGLFLVLLQLLGTLHELVELISLERLELLFESNDFLKL